MKMGDNIPSKSSRYYMMFSNGSLFKVLCNWPTCCILFICGIYSI